MILDGKNPLGKYEIRTKRGLVMILSYRGMLNHQYQLGLVIRARLAAPSEEGCLFHNGFSWINEKTDDTLRNSDWWGGCRK